MHTVTGILGETLFIEARPADFHTGLPSRVNIHTTSGGFSYSLSLTANMAVRLSDILRLASIEAEKKQLAELDEAPIKAVRS